MRIADILREEEDEEQCCGSRKGGGKRKRRWREGRKRATFPSPSSSSPRPPRCLLSRWLPSKQLLKCKPCGVEYKDEEPAEEEDGQGFSFPALVTAAAAAEGPMPSGAELLATEAVAFSGSTDVAVNCEEANMNSTGWKPEQACLNIGMGAGLLLVLSRSMTEFNKMTELRAEMEVLLKEAKEEIQRTGRDPSPISGVSKNNLTFCGSDSWGDTAQSNDFTMHDCEPCLELVESPCDTDNRPRYNRDFEEGSHGIDGMEAQLVSELDLLQISFNGQGSSEQLESSGERTDPSESFSVHLGEPYEPKEQVMEEGDAEEDARDQYGVCPHELMRRLHELLEARQQERIAELESALELAHIKLQEKEMEISLWRDAAHLVSQNKEEAQVI